MSLSKGEKKEFFMGLTVLMIGIIIAFILFLDKPQYLFICLTLFTLAWFRYLGQLAKKYPREGEVK